MNCIENVPNDQNIYRALRELRKCLREKSQNNSSSYNLSIEESLAITLEELKNQQDANYVNIFQQLQELMETRDAAILQLLNQIQDIKSSFENQLTDLIEEYVMMKKLELV
jgi:hypothetical protein